MPATEVHVHDAEGTATAGLLQIKTYLNHEFDTLKVKGSKLVFTVKPEPASAKDPAEVLGSCELPAKGSSFIFLFIPEVPGKPASKVIVVDDSAKVFPPGSVSVLNLTSMPARIELEKKPFEIKAGETLLIEDMPVGPSNSSAMKGLCERDGKWENFASGLWPHPGGKRVLQVLTEAADKQVEIRGIRDVSAP